MANQIIEISVRGEPIGQPRQDGRVIWVNGRASVHMYTPPVREKIGTRPNGKPAFGPDRLAPWKKRIREACAGMAPHGRPITGLVHLRLNLYFPRCAYHGAKRFPGHHPMGGMPIPAGAIPHHARPDKDNCEKAIADALVDGGLLRDDAQICGGGTFKWYCAIGSDPGARIRIEILHPSGQMMLGETA